MLLSTLNHQNNLEKFHFYYYLNQKQRTHQAVTAFGAEADGGPMKYHFELFLSDILF